MSQKSLRLRFDAACCAGSVLCDFGEDRESKRSAEPESELRVILDVLADTEEAAGGVFGVPRCCSPLNLGFNKSSRIEVSPIRSVRKEWRLEVDGACSGGEGV